jgi:uncharacterized HAD superfamily protein
MEFPQCAALCRPRAEEAWLNTAALEPEYMIYKSIADMANLVVSSSRFLPPETDLIVGIPRSGMLAASMIALNMNRKLIDLNSFCNNAPLANGQTRAAHGAGLVTAWDAKHAVIVDDSAASGGSLDAARQQVKACGYAGQASFGVVYAGENSPAQLDFSFETTGFPRIFQWNLFHRREAELYCVDIDGVLCLDPTAEENDDGPRYEAFLQSALPLAPCTHRIGHLVTSRLEKYRPLTERWLHERGIQYGQLHMLDLPTAEERRRLGAHGSFKASVYRAQRDAILFIESEAHQSIEIARRSGKPVLDYGQQLLREETSIASMQLKVEKKSQDFAARVRRKLASTVRRFV